jgi:hypothetical protein
MVSEPLLPTVTGIRHSRRLSPPRHLLLGAESKHLPKALLVQQDRAGRSDRCPGQDVEPHRAGGVQVKQDAFDELVKSVRQAGSPSCASSAAGRCIPNTAASSTTSSCGRIPSRRRWSGSSASRSSLPSAMHVVRPFLPRCSHIERVATKQSHQLQLEMVSLRRFLLAGPRRGSTVAPSRTRQLERFPVGSRWALVFRQCWADNRG